MAAAEGYAPAGPNHYVWWFPGSPVRIHLSLEVIRRLKEQLQMGSANIKGEGLLFGITAEGATEILDFQPVAGGIPETLDSLVKKDGNNIVVGYYRTESGGNLRLNQNDLSLARTTFAQPYHVFLIIQSTVFGPPNAGFFFNGSDSKMAEFSLMEFPFEPSLLIDQERDRLKRAQEAATRRAAAIPRPVPAAPQPPALQLPAAQPRRPRRFWRVVAGLLTFLVAMAAGAALWVNGRPLLDQWTRIRDLIVSHPAAQQPAQAISALAMGLRATRDNADLTITWNRESPVIQAGTSGVLTIKDGTVTREIALDAAQIHYSSIVYSPVSEQVSIQLSVTTPVSTVIESVMLLLPRDEAPKPTNPATTPPVTPRVLKPFTPPSANSHPADQVLPAAPPLTPEPIASGGSDPPLPILFIQPARIEPPSPDPRTAAAGNGPDHAVGTNPSRYHPAEPIKRVVPRLPPPLLATISKPKTIAVRVAIDRVGRVTQAEAGSSSGVSKVVMDRLLEAARAWTFAPARQGDEAVSSEYILQFTFGR